MLEVLPPENKAELTIPKMEIADVAPSALESMRAAFDSFYVGAKKWELQAKSIKITSIDQKAEMAMARVIRLDLKKLRVTVEATRKSLKEESLRRGKAIDGFAAIVFDIIAPIESHLMEQEKFAERLEEQRKDEIRASRREAILTYQPDMAQQSPGFDLAAMTDEQWNSYLEGARIRYEQAKESARLQEEARQQKIIEEAAERERIRVENERLKAEAKAREAAAKAEREVAAAKQAELEAQAKKERAAAAERERQLTAKAEVERAEALRKSREAEATAKAEREKTEAAARAERDQRLAAERKLIDERQAREAEVERQRRKEAAETERLAAEQDRIASQPDKERLKGFSDHIRSAHPLLKSARGKALMPQMLTRIDALAKWLEEQAAKLEVRAAGIQG